MASKLYGVDATIIIYVFVLYVFKSEVSVLRKELNPEGVEGNRL